MPLIPAHILTFPLFCVPRVWLTKTKQSENLRYQLITLKNTRNQITKDHQATKDELNETKLKLEEASLRISNLKSVIESNEVRFNGKVREVEDVKVLLRLETGKGDAMRAKVDETKKKVLDLAAVFVCIFLSYSVTNPLPFSGD